jgi:2-oxoglutarate dehydrogenase E2 component (dihydrolipoamide succinyltransferase)
MSERVTMPALGESVTEGTVTRWLKSVGDQVAVDEPLLEVSTDKVDTEIPSPVAGILLEILVNEDDTVPVGSDLAALPARHPSPLRPRRNRRRPSSQHPLRLKPRRSSRRPRPRRRQRPPVRSKAAPPSPCPRSESR